MHRTTAAFFLFALGAHASACTSGGSNDANADGMDVADAGTDGASDAGDASRHVLASTVVDARFVTREHMLAAFEMQQSGEPLAQSMGRNLGGYDRNQIPPNLYTDPTVPDAGPVLDLAGFASAVESYEYSKQPMNNLALEGGAGVSLAFGPLVNRSGVTGAAALALLEARVQQYAQESRVGIPGIPGYVLVPPPSGNPNNTLGWSGLWPTMHPYRSFDPTINPMSGVSGLCSITPGDGDDGRAGVPANPVGDYECDYTTLHLPMRATQTDFTISPGASGWAAWKYALWITNYLQIMHDPVGNPIGTLVQVSDLPSVGSVGNTIVGITVNTNTGGSGPPGAPGTYLGSSDIEGFQASIMIDGLDNAALDWITSRTTQNGTSLGGFASISAALAYDYTAPLRWLPTAIAVTETPDASGFPYPSAYAITDSHSVLLDLLGLLGGYSQMFALTDHANALVGGSQPAMAYFDGDPFPNDDQMADGEMSLHDRVLALLKLVFITLDRVHATPSGVFVDTVDPTAGPTTGGTISTTSVAYSIVALRALRRSLSSQLTLYSGTTPDSAVTGTPLDTTSFAAAPMGQTFAQRITTLIQAHIDLMYTHLTDATGNALPGWNSSTSQPTGTASDLDSSAAAVRGLLDAFLATGNTQYRDRAEAVFVQLDASFYDTTYRAYRVNAMPGATIDFTALRFAVVQSMLREMYKLVGVMPGHTTLATMLLDRLARLDKLVLNGWDDVNGDGLVDWPVECTSVVSGLPRGGLQEAERALTGEIGLLMGHAVSDRDHDCVPEISYAHAPSALVDEITFAPTP